MIEGISEAASENTQKPEPDEVITSLITALHGEEAVNHEKGEAASVIADTRRRGRPKLFDNGRREWTIGSEAKTERGQMEALYARTAAWTLFEHRHKHPELTEWTGLYRSEDGKEYIHWGAHKITVLAELGRLIEKYKNGEEVAVQWSVEILNRRPKPTIKQAVQMLRRARLNQAPEPDAETLARKILEAVESYAESHPAINNSQIVEALEGVIGWYYEDDEDDEN